MFLKVISGESRDDRYPSLLAGYSDTGSLHLVLPELYEDIRRSPVYIFTAVEIRLYYFHERMPRWSPFRPDLGVVLAGGARE
jgi:hypothetical protein